LPTHGTCPDLTIAEIVNWLDMRAADFERAFLGKAKGGRPKATGQHREREPTDDRARPRAKRAGGVLTPIDLAAGVGTPEPTDCEAA
jgi:hypothetical protein